MRWTWLMRGNLKRETESLLTKVQNNVIRILWGRLVICNRITGVGYMKKDEMVNHIINECSKLAQKEYKTRHDWVGKVIYWELCKSLKFDHAII